MWQPAFNVCEFLFKLWPCALYTRLYKRAGRDVACTVILVDPIINGAHDIFTQLVYTILFMNAIDHSARLDLSIATNLLLDGPHQHVSRLIHDLGKGRPERIGYSREMIKFSNGHDLLLSSSGCSGWLPLFQVQNDVGVCFVVIGNICYAVDMIAIHYPHIGANIDTFAPAYVCPGTYRRIELLRHHP